VNVDARDVGRCHADRRNGEGFTPVSRGGTGRYPTGRRRSRTAGRDDAPVPVRRGEETTRIVPRPPRRTEGHGRRDDRCETTGRAVRSPRTLERRPVHSRPRARQSTPRRYWGPNAEGDVYAFRTNNARYGRGTPAGATDVIRSQSRRRPVPGTVGPGRSRSGRETRPRSEPLTDVLSRLGPATIGVPAGTKPSTSGRVDEGQGSPRTGGPGAGLVRPCIVRCRFADPSSVPSVPKHRHSRRPLQTGTHDRITPRGRSFDRGGAIP